MGAFRPGEYVVIAALLAGLLSSVGYLIGYRLVDLGVGPGTSERVRVFTKAELAKYDGSDASLPMLLCVLGEVFDVTTGAKHYGKGSGYNVFLGQDSSKAFHTGEFGSAVEDVRGLNVMQVLDVTGWRDFYRKHESYRFVGVLDGLYFDGAGQPTDALREVNEMEVRGREVTRREEQLQKQLPSCNMAYSGDTKLTTITCDKDAAGTPRQPRVLTWVHSGTEKEVSRCVCLTAVEIEKGLDFVPSARINEYEGCEPFNSQCERQFL